MRHLPVDPGRCFVPADTAAEVNLNSGMLIRLLPDSIFHKILK